MNPALEIKYYSNPEIYICICIFRNIYLYLYLFLLHPIGEDEISGTVKMYPLNHIALVSEGIRFCCILKTTNDAENFTDHNFKIRISNRTYVSEPIRNSQPSPEDGYDILCEGGGATYYTGCKYEQVHSHIFLLLCAFLGEMLPNKSYLLSLAQQW